MDPRQVRRLAEQSANFGFLTDHPLLVWYGAGAELLVYLDAQSAMFKARAFGDVLARDLVRRTSAKPEGKSFFHQVEALYADGTLTSGVHAAFDRLRDTGNQAVHDHLGEVRHALELLRTCFELGVWFHRALTGDRTPIGFVPPTPPARQVPAAVADGLRSEIDRYQRELAETKLLLTGKPSLAQAQADATVAAERAVQDAQARRGEAAALVASLEPAAQAAKAAFEAQPAAKVSVARREEFIASARRASREPLNEAQTRVEIDRQLGDAGWIVQDERTINLYAGTGVAVREVTLATGRADYLLYVDQRLVGVIEAKREGTAPRGVEAQLDRYRHGLTADQKLNAWPREKPLPFGYVATGTETAFVNGLDPHPRTREVFAFHQPATLARWMREAEGDPDAPTLRARLRRMPALDRLGLRPAQVDAVEGLERSLAHDRPRALIQMATGAEKTFATVTPPAAQAVRPAHHAAAAHRHLLRRGRQGQRALLRAQARP